jgi:hypothetical protein
MYFSWLCSSLTRYCSTDPSSLGWWCYGHQVAGPYSEVGEGQGKGIGTEVGVNTGCNNQPDAARVITALIIEQSAAVCRQTNKPCLWRINSGYFGRRTCAVVAIRSLQFCKFKLRVAVWEF